MQRPGFLNADTVGVLTNSEGSSYASALLLYYNALEYLDSFTVSLFDLTVNLNGISYGKLRYFCFELLSFDVLNTLFVTEDHLFFTTRFILSCFFSDCKKFS